MMSTAAPGTSTTSVRGRFRSCSRPARSTPAARRSPRSPAPRPTATVSSSDSITQPLLPGDSGSCWFVYERVGGVTNPVVFGPRPQDPLPPHLCHGDSFDGVSADGSHLFLSTDRRLIDADEGEDDIYQRVGGALSLVTTYPERVGKANCVDLPKFADASADGGTVLFSTNTAISPEDTDEAFDVYERRAGRQLRADLARHRRRHRAAASAATGRSRSPPTARSRSSKPGRSSAPPTTTPPTTSTGPRTGRRRSCSAPGRPTRASTNTRWSSPTG